MTQQPIALLGFLPLLPYMICFYIAYRMPHVQSGGFWRWILGWASFGYFTVVFAIARTRTVLAELSGDIPFDGTRFVLVFSGSCGLMIFILSLRWSFPNGDRTLWDDLCTDAHRVVSLVRRLGSGGSHED